MIYSRMSGLIVPTSGCNLSSFVTPDVLSISGYVITFRIWLLLRAQNHNQTSGPAMRISSNAYNPISDLFIKE